MVLGILVGLFMLVILIILMFLGASLMGWSLIGSLFALPMRGEIWSLTLKLSLFAVNKALRSF